MFTLLKIHEQSCKERALVKISTASIINYSAVSRTASSKL